MNLYAVKRKTILSTLPVYTVKGALTEIVRLILSLSLIVSAFVFVPIAGELIQGWIQPPGVVQPADQEPTREELKRVMRYHGITYAEEDADGSWFFMRNGERCNIKFEDGK